jgi:transcription antitermination factor NusG
VSSSDVGEERVTKAWYAVYTKFQHEKSAASLLEKKEFEVFLPVYRTVHRWKDRNQAVILPLFPCYLFIKAELDRKLDVLRTAGVRWIVENAGQACAVPEAEIEAVRKICSAAANFQPHPFLKEGDLVRVRTGPLTGTEGFFVRVKNKYRVVVSVELLRKSVAVEIDLADVEVLNTRHRTSPLALAISEVSTCS